MSAKKRGRGGAEETRVMTDGSPLKHIVCFAFPLMLGNICQQIYTLTDTAVVGRVLGVAALAALGACDLGVDERKCHSGLYGGVFHPHGGLLRCGRA